MSNVWSSSGMWLEMPQGSSTTDDCVPQGSCSFSMYNVYFSKPARIQGSYRRKHKHKHKQSVTVMSCAEVQGWSRLPAVVVEAAEGLQEAGAASRGEPTQCLHPDGSHHAVQHVSRKPAGSESCCRLPQDQQLHCHDGSLPGMACLATIFQGMPRDH